MQIRLYMDEDSMQDALVKTLRSGIILMQQQRYWVGEQMRRILKLIATRSAESMVDQIEYLSAWG